MMWPDWPWIEFRLQLFVPKEQPNCECIDITIAIFCRRTQMLLSPRTRNYTSRLVWNFRNKFYFLLNRRCYFAFVNFAIVLPVYCTGDSVERLLFKLNNKTFCPAE